MAHGHHEIHSFDEKYVFSDTFKKKLIIAIVIGLALVGIGTFLAQSHFGSAGHGAEAHHEDAHGATLFSRLIANLWMNSVYFLGISVTGVFFISYNYVAKAGWYSSFKRIPEAFPSFIIVPAAIMLVLFLIPSTRHTIFHWTHEGIMDPSSHHFDKIIAGKSWYLNFPFFLVRMLAYFVVWFWLWTKVRSHSLSEDEAAVHSLDHYYLSRKYSKLFLMFFAVTSSTAAWDFSMSIDTHWFSTMYGWYHLASWHVAGLAGIMLTIVFLKEAGYLKYVKTSSIHDIGKLVFGFSIFWTYVWFSQFLLIFYANLPEETIYFRERFSGYDGRYFAPFMISLVLNFFFPLLLFMARNSKRNFMFIKIVCSAILLGHWFDFYQMHMPGIAKDQGGIGFIEIGTTLCFSALFIYFIANQLSKANLVPKNHPFLEESIHHEI